MKFLATCFLCERAFEITGKKADTAESLRREMRCIGCGNKYSWVEPYPAAAQPNYNEVTSIE